MLYAVLDIETTGGNSGYDKITEIAIYLHDGKSVVDEYVTLINPEMMIPPFITRLTGIDNEMVQEAPRFFEIAKDIVQFTEGATIVAHNANFDYSFIVQEFKSLGYSYSRDYLCTVKLSRKMIPGFRSYSLGNLCSGLGIEIVGRHRAGGDALATVKLFEILLAQKNSQELIQQSVKNDYLHLRFPPEFNHRILDNLPESPGVYYFYNEDGSIIYIGKSNNIRKRVLSHFRNKQSRKALEMRNMIRDVSFESTGNELIALLLESDEIKTVQPVFNRAQKNTYFNYCVIQSEDDQGYLNFKPGKFRQGINAVCMARTQEEAVQQIIRLQKAFNLCQKLCGLYPISHACFNYSVNLCNGACIGKETAELYNQRAEKALASLLYRHQNFMIIGEGRNNTEKTVVQIEQGRYLGFGYFDPESTGHSIGAIQSAVSYKQDNKDVHRIIKYHLDHNPGTKILEYSTDEI
ncbi:MAG: hypothetical protein DWQ44_12440 [Bacteroidetes bacterium]|nr:MAG: hypothetical protein DWQ33_07565 [Bacteroidota bacterium]REK08084.1 MAG: hypothetical protein DWQ39_00585 [Bacteroidota bacterium]REK32289.1 MAG: hypothetical protein DWQ44_12440 [Bacteroidota bacterium]REK49522.1 MAG: hypothetical protein DWQ48_06895 [Bacteroidota bacterium]